MKRTARYAHILSHLIFFFKFVEKQLVEVLFLVENSALLLHSSLLGIYRVLDIKHRSQSHCSISLRAQLHDMTVVYHRFALCFTEVQIPEARLSCGSERNQEKRQVAKKKKRKNPAKN